MDVKRLLSIRGGADPEGPGVTFTLESEGDRQTFSAAPEVFSSVLNFMLDLDEEARRRRAGTRQDERGDDPLQTEEGLDIFLDLRAGRALLRVHTARGRTVQLELSEELLLRFEERLPKVLTELRRQKGHRPH